MESPPDSVSALGDDAEVTWQHDDGKLSIQLSEVAYHVLLVVE